MSETLERIDAEGRTIEIAKGDPGERRRRLIEGEGLHRELRPCLPAAYVEYMERMFAEGARLTQLCDAGEVRAIAVWRVYHTTYCGQRFYIDDLVTSASSRSQGYGRTLIIWLEARARALGCPTLALDSATHRDRAHRFYFREGFRIFGFHFVKDLADWRHA